MPDRNCQVPKKLTLGLMLNLDVMQALDQILLN